MEVSIKRHATRRDANEKEIVSALESIGCTVYRLDAPVDLLVGYRARNILIEVKDGSKMPSQRKLTQAQRDFFKDWKGQVRQVESVDEAIKCVTQCYSITKTTHGGYR